MKFWQVDSFTEELFRGNPAAVFVFEEEPSVSLMMNIAKEMNLSETAFVIMGQQMKIRWFTPGTEVDLCGHATLAAAHILWQEEIMADERISFQSRSGPLGVTRAEKGYTLDFPLQPPTNQPELEALVMEIVGVPPHYVGSNGEDCMAVVDDEVVRSYVPNFEKMHALKERGFLLTAEDMSGEYDYIYRAFFPKLEVPEDPVTGSANTCLAAYWADRLSKQQLKAAQLSERGGHLGLDVQGDRVLITGEAVTVFEGVMANLEVLQGMAKS